MRLLVGGEVGVQTGAEEGDYIPNVPCSDGGVEEGNVGRRSLSMLLALRTVSPLFRGAHCSSPNVLSTCVRHTQPGIDD
jgi:hypothetical protein